MNKNSHRLLELCYYYDLVVTNSYFKTNLQHKVSWRQPHSKKLFRWFSLYDIINVRSFNSVNCDTDRFLVCCKFKLQSKTFYRAKQLGKSQIDTNRFSKPERVQ